MDYIAELTTIASEHGGIIEAKVAAQRGISDRTSFEHTVTAPFGCIPSVAIKAECKVYCIKPELFELGKTALKTPAGNEAPAYDLLDVAGEMYSPRRIASAMYFMTMAAQGMAALLPAF